MLRLGENHYMVQQWLCALAQPSSHTPLSCKHQLPSSNLPAPPLSFLRPVSAGKCGNFERHCKKTYHDNCETITQQVTMATQPSLSGLWSQPVTYTDCLISAILRDCWARYLSLASACLPSSEVLKLSWSSLSTGRSQTSLVKTTSVVTIQSRIQFVLWLFTMP